MEINILNYYKQRREMSEVCEECGGEETDSVFLQFLCAYLNREENIHAGRLVSKLNKTSLTPSPKVWEYVKNTAETNWARILENVPLADRLTRDFGKIWKRKNEFDTMVMVSAMFLYAQSLHLQSGVEEVYVPRRRTSSATSWGLLAGLRRRVRGGAPYLHHLQNTRRGLVLAL